MSERLRKITELYGASLKEFLLHSMEPIGDSLKDFTEAEMVERFSTFDPSRNKSATQWLITTYLNKGFLLEDLSKAYETLLVFSQVKRLLPVEKRSLNKYKTLASMWKTIDEAGLLNSSPYWVKKMGSSRDNLTSKEEKKADKEKAYEDSILVFQDDNLEIVVPLTVFAAQWHGKGTRWCTSADKNNYFDDYNEESPLIIMREKLEDGSINKSQLWVTKDSIQFMDASDAPIKSLEEGDVRIPILKWACSINTDCIKFLPKKCLNMEFCLKTVQQSGCALQWVPKELQDWRADGYREICMAAVRQDGRALRYVVEELKNKEMCMAAVQQYGAALCYVPDELRDREICMTAVKQYGLVLLDVPKVFKDSETSSFTNRKVEDFSYREICLKAVQQYGAALCYVPEEFRDYEMCMAAVKNGGPLYLVPKGIRDYEMCMAAIENDGRALEDVPKEFRDYEMCLKAVQQNGQVLHDIPKELKDYEMCLAVIQQDGCALVFVPKEFRNYEMCLAAVQQDGRALQFIPFELRDYEMCMAAVKSHGFALEYVPKELRDSKTEGSYELCLTAVKQNGWALDYVADELKDYDMCMAAIENDGRALEDVPKELRDYKMCMAAVNQNGLAFKFVAEEWRDELFQYFPKEDISPQWKEWKGEMLLSLKKAILDTIHIKNEEEAFPCPSV